MKTILYLTRNGLMEPLGRSQILPYLIELSKNYKIIVVSSEKKEDLQNPLSKRKVKNLCNKNKIIWSYSKFNTGGFSIPYQLTHSLIQGFYFSLKFDVNIIHCRSYLSNFIGLLLKLLTFKPVVFDMRGLWPEEIALKLPNGKKSLIYKSLKFLERLNITQSNAIVSLTDAAKFYLINSYGLKRSIIYTIPTCVDTFRFKYSPIPKTEIKTFSCIGTILSDWFLLKWLESFFQCIEEFDTNAKFEIITRDCKEKLLSQLNITNKLARKISISSATPDEIPNILTSHSASSMFFKSGISKLGSSPTRFGEILSIGRPIICNSGVGDLKHLVKEHNVGVIVENNDHHSMIKAVEELYELISDPSTSSRCRNLANTYYSLYSGSKEYSNIYSKLLKH
tara:strand:- start:172 stop:1353 length:1182 start_codon:yes stop_codon:yes gene_type:complete